MNNSLSTTAEDFVPSHAPLKNNKHLSILSAAEERKKQVRITKPNFFIPGPDLCLWNKVRGFRAVPLFCQ